ncbi:hypothetical protein [Anaerotignum propionicum]|uniref:MarR family protein n=1 Tax=Anaerotignum propionicum DSM 1682 TaxID=991789 RepID=A0A0X8VCW4_ANAPI|nr:hypothetical protein [Anaerotignum propionicum]AMJ41709.1 hypothetical protein CPRO_21290 [Anaerotignum propionicum DSM 1682]SHE82960.1 hypothetical protein SAMN02745151_01907 [[Clostridium] propionicum DSM 1682] [Anaerotignum propionicum DSM 1682]
MVKSEKVKTGHNVIDITTGEIIMELCEGDRIVTKQQDEHVAEYITNFNKTVPFVKVYLCDCNELYEELTGTEVITISTLINYISYNDNILRINDKPMKITDIADIIHRDYTNVKKLVASLEKKDVIKKIKWFDEKCNKEMNCIAVNPYLFFRGRDIKRGIVELFKDSKWSKVSYKKG